MARIMVATNAVADARVLHVAALRRAESASADLAVVHVISGDDFEAQPPSMQQAIKSETEWLLHTMIALAVERSGVDPVNVTIHVRDGNVPDALIEFASNTRPDSVLIGAPRGSAHNVFTPESFTELLGRFEQAGISVEQVETS